MPVGEHGGGLGGDQVADLPPERPTVAGAAALGTIVNDEVVLSGPGKTEREVRVVPAGG